MRLLLVAVITIALLWPTCVAEVQLQNVYSYLGRGFDLVTGDLRPTSQNDVSVTWSKALIYEVEQTTDGTPTETFQYENNAFNFYTAATPREFSMALLSDVTVVDLVPEIGFGNNSLSNTIIRQIMSFGSQVYVSNGDVALLKASMLRANVSQEFMNDAAALPSAYNYESYYSFISKYGTHYVRNATFGGRISAYAAISMLQSGSFRRSNTSVSNGLRIMTQFGYNVNDQTTELDYYYIQSAGITVNSFELGGQQNQDYVQWKASIEQNPMPINVQLDPYIFLIEDVVIRENMITALQTYINKSIGFDNTLQTSPVQQANFESLWSSAGSTGMNVNIACQRFAEFGGFRRIGDSCSAANGLNNTNIEFIKEVEADATLPRYTGHKPLLADPLSYGQLWLDLNSHATLDGSFWSPTCPFNYFALGHMNMINYNPPATTLVTCVHARCLESCGNTQFWADYGSGAVYDLLLLSPVAEVNTSYNTHGFFGFTEYSPSPTALLNITCVKRACIGTPEIYPATFLAAIEALWSVQPLNGILFSRKIETPIAEPGLSGGIIAAIVVPIVAVVGAGVFLLIFFLVIKRKKKNNSDINLEDTNYVPVPLPGERIGNSSNKSHHWELSPNDVLLQTKLGQGSFGVVWRGKLKRVTDVAIKVTQNESNKTSAEMIKEAQVMAELRPHPNIVQLFGVYTHEDKFHLVMEYCSKGSLEVYLKNHQLDGKTIRDLLRGIASGMSHLHSQNVIHRDLATRNILLSDQGVPKISDFGMARIVGIDNTGKTLNTIGPVKWMSPESLLTREYSDKSDVWSFGVTVWEMIYAREPYEGWDLLELALKIRETYMHPDVSTCEDEFLRGLMLKCWAADSKDRPSFDDLVGILNAEMGMDDALISSPSQSNLFGQPHNPTPPPSNSSKKDQQFSPSDTTPLKNSSKDREHDGMHGKNELTNVNIRNDVIHELTEKNSTA